jgi:hypothetical protein
MEHAPGVFQPDGDIGSRRRPWPVAGSGPATLQAEPALVVSVAGAGGSQIRQARLTGMSGGLQVGPGRLGRAGGAGGRPERAVHRLSAISLAARGPG